VGLRGRRAPCRQSVNQSYAIRGRDGQVSMDDDLCQRAIGRLNGGGANESVADGLDFGRLPHKHGEDAGLLRGARSRRPSSGTST